MHLRSHSEALDCGDRRDPDSPRRRLRSSSSAVESTCNWLDLPRDITAAILLRLGAIEVLNNAQRVCSQWRSICLEPSFWRTIDMRNGFSQWEMGEDLDVMCRHAVDRSCGGLVGINIEHFGTNELLRRITASCTGIKRLRLGSCYHISNEGLRETAAKLPLLEDLELSHCRFSAETLEAVGRHCLHLKSLNLKGLGLRSPRVESDEEAIAIARTMPKLRHLQLFGNKLTNMGLEVILTGCPHLESLDLRRCFNVDLTGKLGRRCAEGIKDLRLPLDCADDYEFCTKLLDDTSYDENYMVFLYSCVYRR